MAENNPSRVWMEKVILPTYEAGIEENIPQFLDKRVYQGSSGKVYPYPVIESISDKKTQKEYTALFLENDYLKIMVLPELGGRIHRAWDKIAERDFVYYNQSIKPALVGLTGPWISGGIEFNWPQHHRPTTFMATDWFIKESDEKSTVYISEWEKMSGQRVLAEFSLYRSSAYLEVTARLFNASPLRQTFLWWANPAVKAGEGHQSIFPPDVTAVCDHGKRDISRFPIATGVYYKNDYSAGVDISRYQNIPVPTSYMAWKSNYDFVGVYLHDEKAGLMHVADRHVVPGKKQWTWGNGDFGQAWDSNLTDSDGPYVELMTGAFTDNQPDFTWLEPWEEKTFTQYFLPYRELDMVHNATKDLLLKCCLEKGLAHMGVFCTKNTSFTTVLSYRGKEIFRKKLTLRAGAVWNETCPISEDSPEYFEILILAEDGSKLLAYRPEKSSIVELPEPASAPPKPEDVRHNEELYYYGLHIEQYRYATSTPEKYWEEALRRDPLDYRCNLAMGRLSLRRGSFVLAEQYFETALKRITTKNANPESGEAYFLLGLALEYQGRYEDAYPRYYKSIWNGAFRDKGYFALARLALRKGQTAQARSFIDLSLAHNRLNHKAQHLDVLVSRIENSKETASKIAAYLAEDPLAFGLYYESYLLGSDSSLKMLKEKARGHSETYIELALLYASCGLYKDALAVLEHLPNKKDPIFYFHKVFYASKAGQGKTADEALREAETIGEVPIFPNRLEDIAPLQEAQNSALAAYYLGCFYYDRKRYNEALQQWEKSLSIKESALVCRCLAIAYYNQEHRPELARQYLDRVLVLDNTQARYLLERDQLAKKLKESPQARLQRLNTFMNLSLSRDDLAVERASLLNLTNAPQEALVLLKERRFHPWEGGEGKTTSQWVLSHLYLGLKAFKGGDKALAFSFFEEARSYPRSLGEGKLPGTTDNDILYWMACCKGEEELFFQAANGTEQVSSILYYNDYPVDYIFWQGMALRALKKEAPARHKFYTLIDYAEQHYNDHPEIPFLSVSIPDLLIFEEDLQLKNRTHCLFLLGMGHLGLGDLGKAEHYLQSALELDPNHCKAHFILWCLQQGLI